MGGQKLNPKIFLRLKKKFPNKSANSIRVKLSKLSNKYNTTLNAAAAIWGKKEGFSVGGLLNDADRESLRDKKFEVVQIKTAPHTTWKKKIHEFLSYRTENPFLKTHLDEINRCYTYGCYTAAFILTRKVIENLIVQIAKAKFPNKTKEDRSVYIDVNHGKILDLSELITNLRKKANSFEPDEKKLVLRILQLSEEFKDDANDKTHSLYHISSKKELDEKNPQQILNLIQTFNTDFLQ